MTTQQTERRLPGPVPIDGDGWTGVTHDEKLLAGARAPEWETPEWRMYCAVNNSQRVAAINGTGYWTTRAIGRPTTATDYYGSTVPQNAGLRPLSDYDN